MSERLGVKATCPECGSREITAPAKSPFPQWRLTIRILAGVANLTCKSCGYGE